MFNCFCSAIITSDNAPPPRLAPVQLIFAIKLHFSNGMQHFIWCRINAQKRMAKGKGGVEQVGGGEGGVGINWIIILLHGLTIVRRECLN